MSLRWKHKSWQNDRPGWTRRVTWYENQLSIRLRFESADEGSWNRYYGPNQRDVAQKDFDNFKEGR